MPCHGPTGCEPQPAAAPAGVPETARKVYKMLKATDPGSGAGKYIYPGRARTSPLVWHVLSRSPSRPWHGTAASRHDRPIPQSHGKASALTEAEIRALVRWIELGAAWGTRVTVKAGKPVPIENLIPTREYLSQGDPRPHLGLCQAMKVNGEVRRPADTPTVINDVPANGPFEFVQPPGT